ncbi:MAG: DUF6259 domain-containing protein [Planctomycetota bacterium]|nr:DUF6259 domain-containing protein [Planctomycetota bacterium]
MTRTWILACLLYCTAGNALAAPSPGAPPGSLPVAFDRIEGGDAASGWLRASARDAQRDAQPIWIEAEQATSLVFEPQAFDNAESVFRGEDAQAGGGRYIAFVSRASYDIDVATAGSYQVWYRAWFPWRGGWNHRESLGAGAEPQMVVDCNAEAADLNHWMWVKGPRHELAAGRQTWELNYNGGARFDRMVLTADASWTPPEKEAGPAASIISATQCVAVTKPVAPQNLARWLRVTGVAHEGNGKVAIEASIDGGKSFVPVNDGDLSALSVRPHAANSLVLRYTLTPGPDGASPSLQGALVTYERVPDGAPIDVFSAMGDLAFRPERMPLVPMRAFGAKLTTAAEGDHLVTLAAGAPVYGAGADGAFWLEAEAGTLLAAYPSNAAAAKVEGAVGSAICCVPLRPHATVWDLDVAKAGKHALFFRVRRAQEPMPAPADRACRLRLDEAQDLGAALPINEVPPGQWAWVRSGRTIDLSSGIHRLAWEGGLRDLWVDRLCVAPEGAPAPSGTGGEAATATPSQSALVEFFPVRPPRGASWGKLIVEGEAQVEASLDGGKTWATSPEPLGSGPLQVRARVGGSCRVSIGLRDAPPLARLGDDAQEMWIAAPGALTGLYDRARAEWVVPPGAGAGAGSNEEAFALTCQSPGMAKMTKLCSAEGRCTQVRRTARGLSFQTQMLDGGIVVTTSVELAEPHDKAARAPVWRIEVANRSAMDVRRVDYPLINRATLGGVRADDALLYPEAFGAPLEAPYHFGAYSYHPIVWPGTASMAWMDLSDRDGGLYFAAYHPDMLGVEFDVGGNDDHASLHMGFRKRIHIGAGEAWSGQYALQAHRGDWHAGADLYRAWADSWMKAPKHPDWFRQCDGYPEAGVGGGGGRFYSRYTDLLPECRYLGIDYIQRWAGTADGEFCGLIPDMNPRYGTNEQLRIAHQAMRDAGVHHTYYINAQGWYPGFSDPKIAGRSIGYIDRRWFPPDFKTEPASFYERAGLRELGGMFSQQGAGVGYTTNDRLMCAASEGWHDHMVEGLGRQRIAERTGDDGSYIDQMGCIFNDCYGEEHGHGKQQAAWGRGFVQIARDVLAKGRKANPNSILGVEGITDVLAQHVDWGLWVSRAEERGEVFLYTRPESILYRGTANGGHGAFADYAECLADTFLCNRFDGFQVDAASMKVLELRRRVKRWMYAGRFMDNAGLGVAGGPAEAKWFRVDDDEASGAVVNIHNWTRSAGVKVTLRLDALPGRKGGNAPMWAVVFTEDGQARATRVESTGDLVAIEAPAARLASVLLLRPKHVELPVIGSMAWPADAGANRVVVSLLNPSDKPRTVALTLTNARELGATSDRQTLEIAPGQAGAATFLLGDRASYDDAKTATVKVDGAGPRQTLAAVVPPLLRNGDFEVDRNNDGVPDGWGTLDHMIEHQFNRFVQDVDVLHSLDGKSGEDRPLSGKRLLRNPKAFDYTGMQLGPPFGRVSMHQPIVSEQRVFLRAGWEYKLRCAVRADAATKGRIAVALGPFVRLEAEAATSGGQWQTLERTFATPAGAAVINVLSLTTDTDGPVDFDAVSLTEIAPAKAAR